MPTYKIKNKTSHQGLTRYALDYLFGTSVKIKKNRNPIFDETNASHRFEAIESLKRKNIKSQNKDVAHHKFKNTFSTSLNMLNALREIYETPYDSKFNNISETNQSDEPYYNSTVEYGNAGFSSNSDFKDNLENYYDSDYSIQKKNKNSFFLGLDYNDLVDRPFGDIIFDDEDFYDQFEFSDYELSKNAQTDLEYDYNTSLVSVGVGIDKPFFIDTESDFDEYDYFDNGPASFFSNSNNSTN